MELDSLVYITRLHDPTFQEGCYVCVGRRMLELRVLYFREFVDGCSLKLSITLRQRSYAFLFCGLIRVSSAYVNIISLQGLKLSF